MFNLAFFGFVIAVIGMGFRLMPIAFLGAGVFLLAAIVAARTTKA